MSCVHFWVIESLSEASKNCKGVCKLCHITKEFPNSYDNLDEFKRYKPKRVDNAK